VKIDHVSDGKAAIKICSSQKYDAILMDINLKEIEGVETLKEIRKLNDHYSNIPIIAITAYALHGDKEKFISFGFTDYLSKPFVRSQLLMLLNETIKKDQKH
jgi:CheY-like chemotaxis protein